ncbi:hypothetical protein HFN76_33650 [Rhizobium laguerreae]|uniref:hypothetical protein n=1 Tax=Rhizobium laguerreae TaxID=1076926 RepID=UPI001C919BDF|nr:hypothetical protein [Rhizobium laguerreae]
MVVKVAVADSTVGIQASAAASGPEGSQLDRFRASALYHSLLVQIRSVGNMYCDSVSIVTDEVDPPTSVVAGHLGVCQMYD